MNKIYSHLSFRTQALSFTLAFLLTACAVGPDYERPPVETPAAFKEAAKTADMKNWKPCEPKDDIDRGAWWTIYQDPILNALESQIDISNQNLKQAEANYRAAVAIADQTRSALFPAVTLNPSAVRSGIGKHTAANTYNLSAGAAWSLDVWGKIRRALERDEADAQATAADLAAARLSAQAELATDYLALRVQDSLQKILDTVVEDDQKIYDIVKNQYDVGVASQADLLSAQSTLEGDRAAAIGAGVKRAQLEHAIAVLTGKAPADFTLMPTYGVNAVPLIPAQVPSLLLERRPDIASAERQMAAANAQIGVAIAGYYPDISLSAGYGFSAGGLDSLLKAASAVWSFGAAAAGTLIDFGAREGATEEARAFYDAAVAAYRQTVLTAFQNVEDNLSAQRILIDQEKAQNAATDSARKNEQVSLNQYKEGVIPYNNLLQAQILRMNAEQQALSVRASRLSASVALIQALGGGWDVKQMKR